MGVSSVVKVSDVQNLFITYDCVPDMELIIIIIQLIISNLHYKGKN